MVKRITSTIILSFFTAVMAYADTSPTAVEVVRNTTDQVRVIIKQAEGYYNTNPQRFYNEIDKILDQVVDFRSFARGVMGTYGSKQRYDALTTQQQKRAYVARINRFSRVFRDALVQTYAKGLLGFGDVRAEVLPTTTTTDGSETVTQRIYGKNNKVYTVLYKMRPDKNGDWKLRNVTIEAVNLGRVYQNQFAAAAQKYDGNINEVINNWTVASAEQEIEQADGS